MSLFPRGFDVAFEVAEQLVPLSDVLMPASEIVDVDQIPAPPIALFELMDGKDLSLAAADQQSEVFRLLPTEVAEALSESG